MADQIFPVSCGFFDAQNNDRVYSAKDMNKPYSRVVSDGVFATRIGTPSTDLQVLSTGTGMQITVSRGQGIFAQKWFENPSAFVLTVPSNSSLLNRIDSVIVQVDDRVSGRVGSVIYRDGTPSAAPEPPPLDTSDGVTEYRIANVLVVAGATSITNAQITDLRGSDACPWVTGLIQQVDTSALWNQYSSAFQQQLSGFDADYAQYVAAQQAAWAEVLSTLSDDLTVDTSVVTLSSTFTATETTTTVPINISSFNATTDSLQVFINGLYAQPGVKYTLNNDGTSITLTSSIAAGNTVYFQVFKSVFNANPDTAFSLVQRLNDKVDDFLADSGWITPELSEGVVADTGNAPAVRCIGTRVYMRGAVSGISATNTQLFLLPAQCCPSKNHVFTTSFVNDGIQGTATITVETSGAVKVSNASATPSSSSVISVATCFLAVNGTPSSAVFAYRGSVLSYSDLPTTGMTPGDTYMIQTTSVSPQINGGDNVFWTGDDWELLQTVISSAEIDSIINSLN